MYMTILKWAFKKAIRRYPNHALMVVSEAQEAMYTVLSEEYTEDNLANKFSIMGDGMALARSRILAQAACAQFGGLR